VGLASGFLEPLESTSIHLIQRGIELLLASLPDRNCAPQTVSAYNDALVFEFERIRDFLLLHYSHGERDDSAFWRHCGTISIPDSLRQRVERFRETGQILQEASELFPIQSWLFVLIGQNIAPCLSLPFGQQLPVAAVDETLLNIRGVVRMCTDVMPRHEDYIAQNCATF
jgi:tryptophan halogenase